MPGQQRYVDKKRNMRMLRGTGLVIVLTAALLIGQLGLALAAWSTDPAVNTPVGTQAGSEQYPIAVVDASGNTFVEWLTYPAYSLEQIHVQKFDHDGNALWPTNGALATPILSSVYQYFAFAPDGAGGVYVVWRGAFMDFDNDGDVSDNGEYFGAYRLYAQRLSNLGSTLWAAPVRVATFDTDLYSPAATTDGAGGLIVAWLGDYPNNHGSVDPNVGTVAAQRLDGSGNRLWGDNGRLIFEPWNTAGNAASGSLFSNTSPLGLVEDGAGGALIAWGFYPLGRTGATSRLNVVRIGSDGLRLSGAYTDEGTYAGEVYTSNPPDFKMVSDGLGGAIMAWQGDNFTDFNIYAQRVDHNAAALWHAGGLAVGTAAAGQGRVIGATPPGLDLASDGSGGAFIVWEDYRPALAYVTPFSQRVNAAGNVQWTANGLAAPSDVSTAQNAPRVIPDGLGGALYAWLRSGSLGTIINAQRLDSTGARLWSSDLAVSTAPNTKDWPSMAALEVGGAVVSWMDSRDCAHPRRGHLRAGLQS